jgi:23S rRNA A1618 N6-methylase RlmF
MTAGLAVDSMDNGREKIDFTYTNSIPPLIKALLQDLSTIRRVTLTESPQILPLIAPALIEAEVHVRNLWQAQA